MDSKTITLYYFFESQPSRSVKAVLDLLEIKYEVRVVNILKGEQNTEEYKKINPAQEVPTISDNEFNLPGAEAIVRYLFNTRPDSDKLYPSDPKVRAQIDRYFPFHHATLRTAFAPLFLSIYPFVFPSKKCDYETQRDKALKAMKQFNELYLQGKKYIVGDNLTIADIFATNEFCQVYLTSDFDFSGEPAVVDYIERCLKNPVLAEVTKGMKDLAPELKETLAKQKKE